MDKVRIELLKQVLELALTLNASENQAIVEVELDGYSVHIFIYAKGVNGDEVDTWKIKLKHHNFDEKVDEVIDRLKELIGGSK